MNIHRHKWIFGILILFSFLFVSCRGDPEQVEVTREVEVPGPEIEVTRIVEVPGPDVEVTRIVEVAPEMPISMVPYQAEWLTSAHADASAEAFVHWDEDDPAEVPVACAKCHSSSGMQDYVGADGSPAGSVDNPVPVGEVVECVACHNDTTSKLTSVTFPSGVEVMGLGDEARCMTCHQGRHSTVSVDAGIDEAGLTEDVDTVSEEVGFSNIHYYAAAATQYGTVAMGGYEYAGKSYDAKFDHVEGYDSCIDCHNSHTLEVKVEECTACHEDVDSVEDFADVRMVGSLVDYDGDGDMEEGIAFEIDGLREILYTSMLTYASDVSGTPIGYDSHSYPYFFIDGDGDGELAEDEANYGNKYDAWTARLAKAAYNYQVSLKDPGRYAHGGKYIIQLLYDSIEDLNGALAEPVDMTMMSRIDHGHFAGSEEAFRHWDEDGFVPSSCSRCHSATGLPIYVEQGVTLHQPTSNGLNCSTCHNDLESYTRYEPEEVSFPSGAVLSTGDLDSNLCLNCHQGRSSAVRVDQSIGEIGADEVSDQLRFLNIHYFAAGASLFGTEAKGAYEFAGNEYLGRNEHVGEFDTCIECHETHALEVKVDECTECHEEVTTRADLSGLIRFPEHETDYDGDGDNSESIANEIDTMAEALYTAMQDYANTTTGTDGILYSSAAYPYFFVDSNGNGEADADEVNFGNRYGSWTPSLLRAAYNYQFVRKDPGIFAHNGLYAIQILYDSIAEVGGDVSGMSRP